VCDKTERGGGTGSKGRMRRDGVGNKLVGQKKKKKSPRWRVQKKKKFRKLSVQREDTVKGKKKRKKALRKEGDPKGKKKTTLDPVGALGPGGKKKKKGEWQGGGGTVLPEPCCTRNLKEKKKASGGPKKKPFPGPQDTLSQGKGKKRGGRRRRSASTEKKKKGPGQFQKLFVGTKQEAAGGEKKEEATRSRK